MKTQPSNWNTRDSSGRKGLDETPQSVARGGSLAARGKRVYSSCGSRREYYDATSFSNTQILLEIRKELLKRSISPSYLINNVIDSFPALLNLLIMQEKSQLHYLLNKMG